jgi:hypothetical protein
MKRTLLFFVFLAACSSDETTPAGNGSDAGPTEDASSFPDGNTGELTPPRRVFVSRTVRTGANGGTAGADAACAQEAKTAMLTGEFIAWLSTPTSRAIDKLRGDAAFITTDGKVLWESKKDIAAGVGPKVPITADVKGEAVTGFTHVWTGADGNGAPTATNCNEWSTNTAGATGGAGVFGGTGKEWTQAAAPKDCGEQAPLLCFEK